MLLLAKKKEKELNTGLISHLLLLEISISRHFTNQSLIQNLTGHRIPLLSTAQFNVNNYLTWLVQAVS